jgi:ribosomal protein L7/L12
MATASTSKSKRKEVDWEAIEREYEAGQLSVRELGRIFGVAASTIVRRAQKNRWQRDLTKKVQAKIDRKLCVPEEVTASATEAGGRDHATDEKQIIELAAQRGVEVVRSHRKLLGESLKIAMNIIEELQARDLPTLEKSQSFRALAQSLAKLVPLERQAFNIDGKSQGVSIDDIIAILPRNFARAVRAAMDEVIKAEKAQKSLPFWKKDEI